MALLGQFSANGGDPPGEWPDDQAVSLRLMGHELRTPLNAIIGFADIIADQLYGAVGDDRYVAHAQMIRESGLRMLDVVSRLVELSRLEAGVADLHLRETPALEPVEDAVRAVAAAAADAGVQVVVEGDGADLRVVCDSRGLSSALGNLLSNAIAFSPPGGPAGSGSASSGRISASCSRCGTRAPACRRNGWAASCDPLPRARTPWCARPPGPGWACP